MAGAIGLGIGALLGFVAGYIGGVVDTLIRSAADIMLTVPGLLVLIVIAASIRGLVSIQIIALVVASLAWMWPTRTIRAQVLSLRERPYVEMARLNGMNGVQIIGRELIPNLLPYLGASFVGAVGSAILAAIGLEALGLGPQHEPTLGMTIYWAIYYSALLRGLWWWWAAPVGAIVVLFVASLLDGAGLDELANPRLRRATRERRRRSDRTGRNRVSWVRSTRPCGSRISCPVPRPAPASSAPSTASPSTSRPGERLGLVGESGSGKSTIALALLRMIKPPGRITGGRIVLDGRTSTSPPCRRRRCAGCGWRGSR